MATRLEFRLHRLDRVVGGLLEFRGNGVGEALRRFRDVVARSPRDLSCQAGLAVEAFERLQALKRTYDPDNVLRRNQNIPPL